MLIRPELLNAKQLLLEDIKSLRSTIDLIFFYGTLQSDGSAQEEYQVKDYLEYVSDDSLEAEMFSTGDYPFIVLSSEKAQVFGEIYRIKDARAWAGLDRCEEFSFEDPEESLYIPEVVTSIGSNQVWVYVWNRPIQGFPQVVSGKWLNRIH